MAITLAGTAGNTFDITKTDTATNTGTATVEFKTETNCSSVTYTNTSKVAALTGEIGTGGTTISLAALANVTVSSDVLKVADSTAPITFASIKVLQVINKSTTATVTIETAASNSLFAASTKIPVLPCTSTLGSSVQIVFPSTTITASSNENIKLVSTANATSIEVYLLG